MSNDRELLEKAAQAAGYTVKGVVVDSSDIFTHLLVNRGHGTQKFRWNPLTDDGDALRLAVRLGMQLDARDPATRVYGAPNGAVDEHHRKDPYAATRRAIVNAVAALKDTP